ncbi:MAG: redoxin family protein [Alphaproteobacteria bacterium]|nr:redoxin family protein [Rickettsiales bacterium]
MFSYIFKITSWLFIGAFRATTSLLSYVFFLLYIGIGVFAIGYLVNIFITNPISIIRPKVTLSYDIQSIDGGRVLSESLKGRKYILFFTAINCEKCELAFKDLESIHEDLNLDIFVVFTEQSDDIVVEMSTYNRLATRIILDEEKALHKQVYAYILPHFAIVNEDGNVILDVTGRISKREIKRIKRNIHPNNENNVVEEK